MTVACYVRVSTTEQNLDRQLTTTHEYAREQLGAELAEIETYRDKSTGTDTARDGYRSMMADVEAGDVDSVVVNSVSRISRSVRDLDRTAQRLAEHGTALHLVKEGLVMKPDEDDPFQNALFRLLGVFAQLEAEMAQQRTKDGLAARRSEEGYHHGRAPLGFTKDDGHLHEADNYDQVVSVLESVQKGETSKRRAAKELDTSRPTIDRALERAEIYGL